MRRLDMQIEDCQHCPLNAYFGNEEGYCCTHKKIGQKNTGITSTAIHEGTVKGYFPQWCPLPEAINKEELVKTINAAAEKIYLGTIVVKNAYGKFWVGRIAAFETASKLDNETLGENYLKGSAEVYGPWDTYGEAEKNRGQLIKDGYFD